MRVLSTSCSEFFVVEDDDYKIRIARKVGGELEIVGLYGVLVFTPFRTYKLWVLAENEEGAKSQAECAVPELKDASDELRKHIAMVATRLPLILRGWGKTEF